MFGPITAKLTFTTPAPISATWLAFATPERWPEVLPDLATIRVEPDGILAPGAVIKTIAKPDRNIIDLSYRVVSVEPERRLAIQSRAEGYHADTYYEFMPVDEADLALGTRIAASTTITAERFRGRFISIVWRSKLVEQVERAIGRRTGALIELAEKISGMEET
ncbi:MAG: SRPBCC family protein [Xanthobacteraceae bacterium]